MAALNVILLVVFVIVCVLIVFLVLLQNEEGDSIGGLFAGGSNSAFGSRSGNILTKSTYVLVTIFFASSFTLAVLNKSASSRSDEGIKKEGLELQEKEATDWYDKEKKDSIDEVKSEESTEEKKNEDVSQPSEDEAKLKEASQTDENLQTGQLDERNPSLSTESTSNGAKTE